MLQISACVANKSRPSRTATAAALQQLEQVSAHAHAAMHAFVFHTLVVTVSAVNVFLAIPDLPFSVPTRTLLLAVTFPLHGGHMRAVEAMNALASLAIVCLPLPGAPATSASLWLLLSRLEHRSKLLRLSVALRSASSLSLSPFNPGSFSSLTHLRLILHSPATTIPAGFDFPPSLTHLAVSPNIFTLVFRQQIDSLTHFSLLEPHPRSILLPSEGEPGFPDGQYSSPVVFGAALEDFFAGHKHIASVTLDNIAVTRQMLKALEHLDALSDLALHPTVWHIHALDDNPVRRVAARYTEDDAACVFAQAMLPLLKSLRLLHIGKDPRTHAGDAAAFLAWHELVSFAPPGLQCIARGRCQTAAHLDLRGSCPRAEDPFTWAFHETTPGDLRLHG